MPSAGAARPLEQHRGGACSRTRLLGSLLLSPTFAQRSSDERLPLLPPPERLEPPPERPLLPPERELPPELEPPLLLPPERELPPLEREPPPERELPLLEREPPPERELPPLLLPPERELPPLLLLLRLELPPELLPDEPELDPRSSSIMFIASSLLGWRRRTLAGARPSWLGRRE